MTNNRGKTESECLGRAVEYFLQRDSMSSFIPNRVLSLMLNARLNPDSSVFPDFICNKGFIEHFQVSSAYENRKGSAHNKALNDFEKAKNADIEQRKTKFFSLPPRKDPEIGTYEVTMVNYEMESPESSYANFVRSFKRNFEKHICSAKKYAGEKTLGIFLIEQVGAAVCVIKDREFKEFYRLSLDAELLKYIAPFSEYLTYIVFGHADRFEILDLQEIPKLLNDIHEGIVFSTGRCINTEFDFFIND